jgi:excisionase family DNA binding protein
MESILLRLEEVAELLGLGRTKVSEMLAAGDLPTVRIGRCVRVPRRELERWVQGRITKASEEGDSSWHRG